MFNRQRRRVTKKRWPGVLAVILVGILLFAGYKYQQYNYLISTPVDPANQEDIIFTVKKGDSLKTIADNLSEKKLILDKDSFVWYGRLNNLDKEIKTGRFGLKQSENSQEIYKIITTNENRQAVVTIPEGSTVQDIDSILAGLGLGKAGDFILAVKQFDDFEKYPFLNREKQSQLVHPLEGYLFPDTYYVSATSFSEQELISLLLNTFSKKAWPIIQGKSHSADQIINVAAMVEKEANRDQDRPIIAGIIWKRLDENWMLGIDATLLYMKNDREIDYHDLQSDTPYNTRNKQGLPPGPIANPGLASIEAATQPSDSPYYFYLTSKDGQMVYATTNTEHLNNKAKYL